MLNRATFKLLFLIGILAGFTGSPVSAQMSATPHHIALGGGVAYSTGLSAHFINPANLMLQNDQRRHQITLGLGGVYYSEGFHLQKSDRLPAEALSYFFPDDPPDANAITDAGFDRMFSDSDRYHMTQSYEMVPLGYSWSNGSRARSFAMRSRGLASFEMNRNWFAADKIPDDPEAPFVRFLNENYQVFHEISFAMAREVTMLNQWQAGLNTLYIGLSPKFLLGGMYSQVEYESVYQPVADGWQNTGSMEMRLAGDMDRFLTELLRTGDISQAYQNHFFPSSNFEINGVGFGIDAGLTYIIPLGDDISLSPYSHEPLRKSLRFSIALTDLGVIRYHSNSTEWQSRSITRTYPHLPETDKRFTGKPGEVFQYLQNDPGEEIVLGNLARADESAFYVQLPTELHIGSALQYQWLTSMVDLNYRFNSPDFKTDGWRLSLGAELRLFRYFPVMGSIQMDPDGKTYVGAGAGLDLGMVKATGAVRIFRSDFEEGQWYVNSLSALALQIRF